MAVCFSRFRNSQFLNTDISQDSRPTATRLSCLVTFNDNFIANLLPNLPVKEF